MSYDTQERVVIQDLVVELYEFMVGTQTYRYTSAKEDKTPSVNDGLVYTSDHITRTDIAQTSEINKDGITIQLHRTNAVALLYQGRPPDQTNVITVRRYHEAGVAEEDVVTIWAGRVLGCSFDGSIATLTCESTATSMKQAGLWRQYQASCPHVLYGTKCSVAKATHELHTTASVVTGDVIEAVGASVYPDDYFTGGFLNWLGADGNLQSRMIFAHDGEELTLDWAVEDMAVTDDLWIYPGCKHTMSDCFGKYINIANYGGFPFVPSKNPFETTVY